MKIVFEMTKAEMLKVEMVAASIEEKECNDDIIDKDYVKENKAYVVTKKGQTIEVEVKSEFFNDLLDLASKVSLFTKGWIRSVKPVVENFMKKYSYTCEEREKKFDEEQLKKGNTIKIALKSEQEENKVHYHYFKDIDAAEAWARDLGVDVNDIDFVFDLGNEMDITDILTVRLEINIPKLCDEMDDEM